MTKMSYIKGILSAILIVPCVGFAVWLGSPYSSDFSDCNEKGAMEAVNNKGESCGAPIQYLRHARDNLLELLSAGHPVMMNMKLGVQTPCENVLKLNDTHYALIYNLYLDRREFGNSCVVIKDRTP